jgi:hypothetical protein
VISRLPRQAVRRIPICWPLDRHPRRKHQLRVSPIDLAGRPPSRVLNAHGNASASPTNHSAPAPAPTGGARILAHAAPAPDRWQQALDYTAGL